MLVLQGNLSHFATVAFQRYGKIKDIDIKQPARPPAFAFVTFDSSLDAEDAVRGRDGYNYDGYRLRCEFARGDRGNVISFRLLFLTFGYLRWWT